MRSVLDPFDLHPIRIPMRHRFRGIDHREAVLIRGPQGWGEFSPFPEYSPEVAALWLSAALELASVALPEPGRRSVPVNVTIPAVDPEIATALVVESGATTAKVKIGGAGDHGPAEHARVKAVRQALGSDGYLRVDVNGKWDVETACRRLEALDEFDLQYAEQPVATIPEMVELRKRVRVLIAADEVVREGQYPLRVVEEGGADVLIVKVQPMGGVKRVLDLAERSSIPVVISSAVETSVGMYGGLLAASLLDEVPFACGLGTVSLIDGDPTLSPLIPSDGELDVRRPEPDPDLLARWRPDPRSSNEILRRVRQAGELLE